MLPNIKELLSANADINALIAGRIYRHGEAPQGTIKPYITWFIVGATPENALSCVPDIDKFKLQVDTWSEQDAQVVQITKLVRSVLEIHANLVDIPSDERDEKTRLFRMTLEFDWLYSRS